MGEIKSRKVTQFLVYYFGLTAILFAVSGCQKKEIYGEIELAQKPNDLSYPVTERKPVVDTYFGYEVIDPYRWLEDDRSEKTGQWVDSQNTTTSNYLSQISYTKKIADRLSTLWDYEKLGAPFQEGAYTYFYKNDGLQNQYVLYRYKENLEDVEIFIDPNSFSEDGTVALTSISFSKDGALAAYSISRSGSDWREIIVIDVETKEQLEPTLNDIKFSGISWVGNEGFYYSSYEKPEGSILSDITDHHKLYFHRLGESQESDEVVFGGSEDQKHRYVSGSVTDDERYLVISATDSTTGNFLYFKDLESDTSPILTILDDASSDAYVLDHYMDNLLIVTDYKSPNNRIVTASVESPTPEYWVDFVPEKDSVMTVSLGGNNIFVEYLEDALSVVSQFDYGGNLVRQVKLPGLGSVGAFSGKKEDKILFYSFSNYSTPSSIYKFDVESGESTLYEKPSIDFDPENYISTQVFYESKDGTKVPMMITHKKSLILDGSNPTILYGYGGFDISLTPNFRTSNAFWLEQGGIYAVPNIRGGGEYGKTWHVAGTQQNKQNVFDDFAAAARYLIERGYTSSDKLAISGGSNGGLLVGALVTQYKDLFKVALPAVGVLDMLRYHKFTAGAGWAFDYGTSDQSEEMFKYLLGYSPVHNVNERDYPAVLVTTGDHDDRVVPAHSYKFAAHLQARNTGVNPTLIRIERSAGHGAGTPVSKIISQYADRYAFTLFNMGYMELPKEY